MHGFLNDTLITYCNSKYVSPFRYFVDDEVLDRVPYLFLLLGGIWGAIELIMLPFIRDPTEEEMSELEKVLLLFVSKSLSLFNTSFQ